MEHALVKNDSALRRKSSNLMLGSVQVKDYLMIEQSG